MFFFNDTATTEIYTLSLHDALPIFGGVVEQRFQFAEGILNIVQHLFYTGSGICFDTAYSCRNRTFGNDFQHPDASGGGNVRTSAEFDGRAETDDAHLIAVLLSEECDGSHLFGFFDRQVAILLQRYVGTDADRKSVV